MNVGDYRSSLSHLDGIVILLVCGLVPFCFEVGFVTPEPSVHSPFISVFSPFLFFPFALQVLGMYIH